MGIMVYQEQLIEIGRLAKMKNPDLLRQATGELFAVL
jgi:DNA polymerase III alpha subunit